MVGPPPISEVDPVCCHQPLIRPYLFLEGGLPWGGRLTSYDSPCSGRWIRHCFHHLEGRHVFFVAG